MGTIGPGEAEQMMGYYYGTVGVCGTRRGRMADHELSWGKEMTCLRVLHLPLAEMMQSHRMRDALASATMQYSLPVIVVDCVSFL